MVENITVYESKILKDFVTFATKKSRLITYISCLVIVACAILEFVFGEYILGGIFLGVGIMFFIFNLCLVQIALKRTLKMPKIKNHFKFMPDKLEITSYSNDVEMEASTIPYTAIIKIVENKDVMYMYINKTQALLVDISKFASNEDKEIAKRYIINNNNKVIYSVNRK